MILGETICFTSRSKGFSPDRMLTIWLAQIGSWDRPVERTYSLQPPNG
jgi:hypothetical protein